jgi:hypothetical protein
MKNKLLLFNIHIDPVTTFVQPDMLREKAEFCSVEGLTLSSSINSLKRRGIREWCEYDQGIQYA